MEPRFKGQVAVITGGGRGIGREVALALAAEGGTAVIAGRRMDALDITARECVAAGGNAEMIHCDVLREEQLKALVGHTIKKYARIDVLVNNAGVVTGGRLDEIDPEDVRRMVDVNIWAMIRLTQLALPHMRDAGSGTIVNLSSVAGRVGLPYYATYCASKYAVRGFSEALRRELRPEGIHVMAVYPGGTATDMLENVDLAGLTLQIATAARVAQAIVRGVRNRTPEVFIGATDELVSRWNDLAPWSVDYGVDAVRERVRQAVSDQRTR